MLTKTLRLLVICKSEIIFDVGYKCEIISPLESITARFHSGKHRLLFASVQRLEAQVLQCRVHFRFV